MNPHGIFLPLRQTGQDISHFLLNRPAPGLKKRNQILLYFFGELLHPQVHLASLVFGDAREGLVLSKKLGEWLPPKSLLELGRERRDRMGYQVAESNCNMRVLKNISFTVITAP